MPASDTHTATDQAAEVTRRTTEGARAAVEATRGLLDNSSEAGRKLFDAWASGAEAALRATFELQNASLSAGMSLLQATASSDRTVLQQWDSAAHQAQQAALEAFQAQVRATARIAERARATH